MKLSPPIASMPDATLVLPAPAKLNLFLHITGRRADGYHELQTLFHFLEACDWLGFRPRDDGHIGLHSEIAGVAHDSNLIVRAARLLQAHSRTTQGADIWLDKHLPMGGGLGGGSSDAATTLLGLNHLWRLGLSLDELAALGLQLGADVPVFVRGQTAFAEGVGERLTPVELEESWYLVLIPDVFVSTAEIFSAPELTRNTPIIKFRGLPEGGSRNDCQPVVEARYPAVAEALKMLGVYTQATMTGTGACVFGSFPNREDADKVSRQLPVELKRFVTKSCNRSKVHEFLQSR